jgi:hypothetical protein
MDPEEVGGIRHHRGEILIKILNAKFNVNVTIFFVTYLLTSQELLDHVRFHDICYSNKFLG